MGAVVVCEGQLLVVRRGRAPGRGDWSVPGGRVEHGETLSDAVVRELAEETGLHGVCGDMLGWVERIGDGYHFVILDFAVTVATRDVPMAGDDAVEAVWVPLGAVGDLGLVEGLVDFLSAHGVLPAC